MLADKERLKLKSSNTNTKQRKQMENQQALVTHFLLHGHVSLTYPNITANWEPNGLVLESVGTFLTPTTTNLS